MPYVDDDEPPGMGFHGTRPGVSAADLAFAEPGAAAPFGGSPHGGAWGDDDDGDGWDEPPLWLLRGGGGFRFPRPAGSPWRGRPAPHRSRGGMPRRGRAREMEIGALQPEREGEGEAEMFPMHASPYAAPGSLRPRSTLGMRGRKAARRIGWRLRLPHGALHTILARLRPEQLRGLAGGHLPADPAPAVTAAVGAIARRARPAGRLSGGFAVFATPGWRLLVRPVGELEGEIVSLRPAEAEGETGPAGGRKAPPSRAPARLDCASVDVDCRDLPADEKHPVKKSPNREGSFTRRPTGNPGVDLSIQLFDYDVNDWIVSKPKHVEALDLVLAFIRSRAAASEDPIEVTLSGATSLTGSKAHNDQLSCRRAICAAAQLRAFLPADILARTKFDTAGNGFKEATCRIDPNTGRNECELPEFRSVLVSVHAPGQKPERVEVLPEGWDRYAIRCCSFQTQSLAEVLVGELLSRGLAAIPESVRKQIPPSILDQGWLAEAFRAAIDRIPKLAALLGKFARFFPAEIVRDTGVFQIVETGKAEPGSITLCWVGFGIRIPVPSAEGLDRIVGRLPAPLRERAKAALRALTGARGMVPALASATPGPFKPFALDRNVRLQDFAGSAQMGKDALSVGKVTVMFGSPTFTTLRGPRARITPASCSDCAGSVIPVQVGDGTGFELFGVTHGTLASGSCVCGAPAAAARRVRLPARRAVRA